MCALFGYCHTKDDILHQKSLLMVTLSIGQAQTIAIATRIAFFEQSKIIAIEVGKGTTNQTLVTMRNRPH